MTTRKLAVLNLFSLFLALTLGAQVVRAAEGDPEVGAPATPDFVLFSNTKIKPERIVDFKKALLPYAALTRTEAGNAAYFANQSPEDPTEFEMYEHWKSDEARSAHLAAPYTVQFFAQVAPMFEPGYPVRKKFIDLR